VAVDIAGLPANHPAKLSPDAYIQQALQLAWYKDQGYATATYETASTRMMLHGRTDVIRTLSVESRSFVKAMLDSSTDVSTSCYR
jgi:carnitine O-acetyltransferase